MSFLADTPDYSPTLLRGRLRWKRAGGEQFQCGIYRLVAVMDGVHEVTTRDTTVAVEPGGIYLVQPGQWNNVRASKGASAMLLAFTVVRCALKRTRGQAWDPVDPEHLQPSPATVWKQPLPLVLDPELAASLVSHVQVISSIWWRDRWHHFRANMRLAELLERIVTHYREAQGGLNEQRPDHWVGRVYQLVNQRLATIRTTSDLAAAFGLGRDHFTRRFQAATGQTPASYLRRRRLDEAALLLRSTAWSIEAIAEHVGYPSRGAFHQAWRKAYAASPRTWRNG